MSRGDSIKAGKRTEAGTKENATASCAVKKQNVGTGHRERKKENKKRGKRSKGRRERKKIKRLKMLNADKFSRRRGLNTSR